MPLFKVQDPDRPMWIIADTFGGAIEEWNKVIAIENDIKEDEVDPPIGVEFICPDEDIVITGKTISGYQKIG